MGVAGRATVVLACFVLGGCGSPPGAHPSSNDGGSTDAGTTDAGTTDAGATDGGTMDAGATDGGTTDGGMTDGGMTDGGTTDAGTTDGGTSDGGTTDGGTSDGGTTDGGTCAPVDFAPTEAVPSIVVLVDGSGSMSLAAGGATRYQAVQDALVGATGAIRPLQHKAYFGASVFTTSGQTCPQLYTFAPALDAANAIDNLLASYGPSGTTPTGPAIAKVVASFANKPPPNGSPPMIVLVTDGLPNDCGNTTGNPGPAITEAGNAYAAGIRLYIVGIASADATYLQDMANAGAGVTAGQPNATYYTGTDSATLETAFATIFDNAVCRLTITGGTIDTAQGAKGTLSLDGNALSYGTDWTLVDGSTIALLGSACATFEADASPTFAATFPCSAVKP